MARPSRIRASSVIFVFLPVALLVATWNIISSLSQAFSIATVEPIIPPKFASERASRPPKNAKRKYLKYASQWGWANQLKCLKHALWFAKSLNRTLVLAPAMAHYGNDNFGYGEEFRYEDKIPYVRMDSVLDVSLTFAGVVDTVDYLELQRNSRNLTEFRVSDLYNRTNTLWTLGSPEKTGATIVTSVPKFRSKKMLVYNQTYRDMRITLGEQSPYESFDVLTIREAFYHRGYDYDSAALGGMHSEINVTYSEPIRLLARQIAREHLGGNDDAEVGAGGTYAAMHLRVGDGPNDRAFNFQDLAEVTDSIFDQVTDRIMEHRRKATNKDRTSKGGTENLPVYHLLVVTDLFLPPKSQAPAAIEWFRRKTDHWRELKNAYAHKMKDEFNVRIRYVFASDYERNVNETSKRLKMPADTHLSVFVDQQLAACAPLGFGLYNESRSSFTKRIDAMRKMGAAC